MTITINSTNSNEANAVRLHFEHLQTENATLRAKVMNLQEQNEILEEQRDSERNKIKKLEMNFKQSTDELVSSL